MRMKNFPVNLSVLVCKEDYFAFPADDSFSGTVRGYIDEEFQAVLAGDREAYHHKMGKMNMKISLSQEQAEKLDYIREFYGFGSRGETLRALIEMHLRTS